MAEDRIKKEMIVEDVITWFPAALDALVNAGFPELKSPVLRKTFAKVTTLERACGIKGMDPNALVEKLNLAVASKSNASTSA